MTCLPPLEVSSSRPKPFSATQSFPGRYASLAKIGDFVRDIAQNSGFQDFAIYSIEMAVDEACSNIIEHAYEGEDKGQIRCSCLVESGVLTITLEDTGHPFNFSQAPIPNLSDNLDDREAHGLGLYFIRRWMDEVYFETSDEGNTLIMIKRKVNG